MSQEEDIQPEKNSELPNYWITAKNVGIKIGAWIAYAIGAILAGIVGLIVLGLLLMLFGVLWENYKPIVKSILAVTGIVAITILSLLAAFKAAKWFSQKQAKERQELNEKLREKEKIFFEGIQENTINLLEEKLFEEKLP